MQIQVSTTSHVDNRDDLVERIEADIDNALSRFGEQITRVDVHLGDENGDKSSADDKRCTVEARVAGSQHVAVTHHAGSYDDAFDGATHKLRKLLDHRLGKLRDHKAAGTIRHLPVDEDAV